MAEGSARGRIEAEGLAMTYGSGSSSLEVLRDVGFEVPAGDRLVIVGPSGSGKSTLLHVLGTLERPTAGTVRIDSIDPAGLSEEELARFRNERVGFVFQDHHLLPQFSLLQNVVLPSVAHRGSQGAVSRAEELLQRVGLGERVGHRPAQLSGGERQRGAIARALINRPSVLLCDEPTGNLDRRNAEVVADLLFELHQAEGSSLVVVTHSLELAQRFDRRMTLEDGRCSIA